MPSSFVFPNLLKQVGDPSPLLTSHTSLLQEVGMPSVDEFCLPRNTQGSKHCKALTYIAGVKAISEE